MADISDFQIDEDGDPIAQILLPTGATVELRWIDEDDNVPTDEQELRGIADKALDGLSAEQLEAIEADVVTELTDSAFQDEEREIEEEDYRKLAGDMNLTGVNVFTDGTVTLDYEAPRQYPDMMIYVQLDEDYGIEELMVEADD